MEEQRKQSQAAQSTMDLTAGNVMAEVADRLGGQSTEFLGYTSLSAGARVAAIVGADGPAEAAAAGSTVQIVLDRTPFYAESGGQVRRMRWPVRVARPGGVRVARPGGTLQLELD
eukprot:1187605-Prorocentrum_minimum.AAC.2